LMDAQGMHWEEKGGWRAEWPVCGLFKVAEGSKQPLARAGFLSWPHAGIASRALG